MTRSILTVGYQFPGGVVESVSLDSQQSLSDADIIVFQPGLALGPYSADSTYEGKPSLHEAASFQAKERMEHWRRELHSAFNSGKLIIVFMVSPEDVFIKTGKSVSGTGRNAQVTNYVAPLSSYAALPVSFKELVSVMGTKIAPAGDLKYLSVFWKEFGERLRYQAYFAATLTDIFMKTRSGERTVGGAIRKGKGTLLLLPPLHFEKTEFMETVGNKKRWNKKAREIGHKFVHCITEIAKVIAAESQLTPPPDWVSDSRYRLQQEGTVEAAIALRSAEIERLHEEREVLRGQLRDAGGLRRLLFEKGHQLEEAILEALRLMGFKAEPFKDGESEFDAVFVSEEGRFLGEAEGKDSHAVNIDKLSQLERNIQEDFARPDVDAPAKGVLFGNAYRLENPENRADPFTVKCRSGAARSRTALVSTPDLFAVARYLKEQTDPEFAKACRAALLATEGANVRFPSVPLEPKKDAIAHQAAADDGSPNSRVN
jgi:hypothetical protein